MLTLNLTKTPFSCFGSYFVFADRSRDSAQSDIVMRSVHGGFYLSGKTELLRIELIGADGAAPYLAEATPTMLTLESRLGRVEIAFMSAGEVRFRCHGLGVRLSYLGAVQPNCGSPSQHNVDFNSLELRLQLRSVAIGGALTYEQDAKSTVLQLMPADPTAVAELALVEYEAVFDDHERVSFEDGIRALNNDYGRWLQLTPSAPNNLSKARELAAYVNWSAVVAPAGHLKRPGMLMSKNWMLNVWSWDHCFNAMALAYHHPDLAWDQFMLLFDAQHSSGMLPDCINDRDIIWNFTKPPIHGWVLKWMMDRAPAIDNRRLGEIYEPLCNWTEFWLNYRDYDNDGIPQYDHGNESGWDNSTVFDEGNMIETPDLAAFLVLQMETLALVASRLGKEEEAAKWSGRAADTLVRLLEQCRRGSELIATHSCGHKVVDSQSLLLLIPLVLGKRLPADTAESLVARLKAPGAYLTEYGLATERLDSEFYKPNGYWRGPIWAPATMLIVSGLVELGEDKLARDIAFRFCSLCAKSGFAENFDALTGDGLCDQAYTWTSSVFLVLAHEYV